MGAAKIGSPGARLALALALAGCAHDGARLHVGVSTETEVRRDMGAPTEIYAGADGARQLAYARGPLGVRTFMAHLSRDGVLRRFEQVLDEEHFDQVVVRRTTRGEVRRLLGPPSHVYEPADADRSGWEYRFRDAWGYTAEFTAIFDAAGVVVDKITIRLDNADDGKP